MHNLQTKCLYGHCNFLPHRNMTHSSVLKRWIGRWLSPAAAPAERPRGFSRSRNDRESTLVNAKELKKRRSARRENLYAVVRENMIRAGVLSSAYKFKVLTLDNEGLTHTVLIDIRSDALAQVTDGQNGLELGLRKLADERLGLEVKSVYWRTWSIEVAPAPRKPGPFGHDEITAEEIAALQQALHVSAAQAPAHTSPRDFEATRPQMPTRTRRDHPLSDTQHGDLE
jgi:hypothetical protein